jgi:hypothetical protein
LLLTEPRHTPPKNLKPAKAKRRAWTPARGVWPFIVFGDSAPKAQYQNSLVSCPRNKHAFRRRSVGCFSRRERRAYLNRYVRSESRGRGTEKQPTARGPEGCDENGPAAVPRLRDRLRIALDMRPPCALPAAHFDRDERHAYFGDRTIRQAKAGFGRSATLGKRKKRG